MERERQLINDLLRPAAWPHAVRDLKVIDTHISWVILTGDYAYKIKKPVELGFLDFSTLERRRHFCEEEVRINRRTAPGLYLGVVPLGMRNGRLQAGCEPAVEFAVRMRQFPHAARLDRRLQAKLLSSRDAFDLAAMLAAFHDSLPPRAMEDAAFEIERVLKPARNNFVHLDSADFEDVAQQRLAVIEDWTAGQSTALAEAFSLRALEGRVRECHGDLHLENLLWLDGQFVAFDALEFDASLRWIDVANDIAFLVMDLAARGHCDLAWTALSGWLEASGDYAALVVMRYYLVYRSMVRAVVASIRRRQGGAPIETSARPDASRYVELASSLVDTPPARLYLMHGFSGSGKTWRSERLVAELPALRVRSDRERRRLPGLSVQALPSGRIDAGLYAPEISDLTYARLSTHCETGLRAGFDMIADATFLERRHRRLFLDLAARLGVRPFIVDCAAPEEELRRRISERARLAGNDSDADHAVLERQLRRHDPLDEDEQALLWPGQGTGNRG